MMAPHRQAYSGRRRMAADKGETAPPPAPAPAKPSAPAGPNNVIAAGCRVTGNLILTGSLRLSGEVLGDVRCDGALVVEATGKIRGRISASDILVAGALAGEIIAARRIEVSAGGRVDLGGSQQPLRTLSSLQSAEELSRLELSLSDGRRVRLDQIATIQDTVAEPTAAAFLNGKPVVGFEVARSRGASEIEVGNGVREKLKELRAARQDLSITESFDFVTPVQEEFDGSMVLLYEGAILAVLVVWLFLRDFRATVVSAVALPLSAIPAFIGMHYLGFTINVITLLAMSLVIGILVD
ncbi:MAG: hypothetical protein B7Z22_11600, partial [Hyphomonas sp. 32-62-5]